MNWVLTGQKIDSRDPIFRGLDFEGLEMRLTWIGYKCAQIDRNGHLFWLYSRENLKKHEIYIADFSLTIDMAALASI